MLAAEAASKTLSHVKRISKEGECSMDKYDDICQQMIKRAPLWCKFALQDKEQGAPASSNPQKEIADQEAILLNQYHE